MSVARPDDFLVRSEVGSLRVWKFPEDNLGVTVEPDVDTDADPPLSSLEVITGFAMDSLKDIVAWAYNLGFEQGGK